MPWAGERAEDDDVFLRLAAVDLGDCWEFLFPKKKEVQVGSVRDKDREGEARRA